MNSTERLSKRLSKLASMYMGVKSVVIDAGYGPEIEWQEAVRFSDITESDFLREAGWVILSCGMRESIIRDKFPLISAAFFEWKSAARIVHNRSKCLKEALSSFRHEKKIEAIIHVATSVYKQGFHIVCQRIASEGVGYIITLPYMGPATSYHLAKNLGLPVAKPDRHLERIAKVTGYDSPQALCTDVAHITGDKISVVDLIFWRFATLETDYLAHFANTV